MSFAILTGDVREMLETLPTESVQTVITSPPYYGLRDYGVTGQIGLEGSPDEYVAVFVEVFRCVRRVLKQDGTLWLNLGDSYAAGGHGGGGSFMAMRGGDGSSTSGAWAFRKNKKDWREAPNGYKAKDLLGIPWLVAFALRADGWYLRSDIIWAKPNPMPESVTDRPTRAHEYLFLLTKSKRYYYNADAIREPYAASTVKESKVPYVGQATKDYIAAGAQNPLSVKARITARIHDKQREQQQGGANKRSVWWIAPQPFKGAHFATFPEKLVEPCVLAGSAPGDTVLDPFCGSGRSGIVALKHGRDFIGIELNPEYVTMATAVLSGTQTAVKQAA